MLAVETVPTIPDVTPTNARPKRATTKRNLDQFISAAEKATQPKSKRRTQAKDIILIDLKENELNLNKTVSGQETEPELKAVEQVVPKIKPYEDNYKWVNEEAINQDLMCPFCMSPVQDPIIHSKCERLVCKDCSKQSGHKCSICREIFNPCENIPKLVRNMLAELQVSCNQCKTIVKKENWKNHWSSVCKFTCLLPDCTAIIEGALKEEEHLKVCEFHENPCSFASNGCIWKGVSKNHETHLKECEFKQHFDKVAELKTMELLLKEKSIKFTPAVSSGNKNNTWGTYDEPLQDYLKVGLEVEYTRFNNKDTLNDGVVAKVEVLPTATTVGVLYRGMSGARFCFSWECNRIRRSYAAVTEQEIIKNLIYVNSKVDVVVGGAWVPITITAINKQDDSITSITVKRLQPYQYSPTTTFAGFSTAEKNFYLSVHIITAPFKNKVRPYLTGSLYEY